MEACEINLDDIIEIEYYDFNGEVYDLHVDDNFNYIITDNNIIVHNSKSFTGCVWQVLRRLRYPGSRGFIARAKLKSLRQSTLLTLFEVLKLMNLTKDIHWTYHSMDGIIKFFNGSTIYLKDLFLYPSDPEFVSLGSTEYTDGFIDEMGEITEQAYNIIKSRIRFKLEEFGLIPKIFMGSNPCKTFVYREFYKKYIDGQFDNKEYPKELHKCYIPARVYDNPFISLHYIENLKRLDPVNRERLLEGNWEYNEDAGIMIDYNKLIDMFSNQYAFSPDEPMYISCDVARFGKDKAVIIVWQGLYIKYIYDYGKCSLRELRQKLESIMMKHRIPRSHCIVDDDGVGCLTPETELLTPIGFVKACDLKVGDLIYSKDEYNNLTIEKVKFNNKIDGMKIININGYEFSRGHMLPVKTRKEYKYKIDFWEENKSIAGFYLDTNVINKHKSNNILFNNTKYKMPNGGYKTLNNKLNISPVIFSAFLGWFLSEGCFDNRYITISQSEKSNHNDEINRILNGMNVKFYITKHNGEYTYKFGHKQLLNWLKAECYNKDDHKAWNKIIPNMLYNQSKEVISSFLDAFIKGDGYIHKGANCYVSSSKAMIDGIQSLCFLRGGNATISIKQLKGSESYIYGRKIIRKRDVYQVYERKTKTDFYIRPKNISDRIGIVHNIKISGKTKLFINRVNGRLFWTHNGGIVDELEGVIGFVNNSRAIEVAEESYQEAKRYNYKNLKTQCYFKLAEYINAGKIGITPSITKEQRDYIIEELEQLKRVNIDRDGPLMIINKEEWKSNIGRSPDYSDSIMFRMFFEFNNEYDMFTLDL